MGNRQHRKRPDGSALDEAASRAILAYEGVARGRGVELASVLVIGVDQEGKANISLSCDDSLDPDDVVKAAAVAYFEGKGRQVAILDQFPRR